MPVAKRTSDELVPEGRYRFVGIGCDERLAKSADKKDVFVWSYNLTALKDEGKKFVKLDPSLDFNVITNTSYGFKQAGLTKHVVALLQSPTKADKWYDSFMGDTKPLHDAEGELTVVHVKEGDRTYANCINIQTSDDWDDIFNKRLKSGPSKSTDDPMDDAG